MTAESTGSGRLASSRREILIAIAILVAMLLIGLWLVKQRAAKTAVYHDSFAAGTMTEWTPYGGSWQITGNTMTNNSNEWGSRLLAGSEGMQDVAMHADVRLSNSFGDAGLVFRVTQPEEGTNAFYGYYAAIRLPDLLVLARMDYGFQPLQIVPIRQHVAPGRWYHLHVRAKGCDLAVEASDEDGTELARAETHDGTDCQRRGSFGLRSFAAGGSWRDVEVRSLP